ADSREVVLARELSGPYLHDLALGARGWHRRAVLPQPVDVKLYRLTNQAQHFRAGLSNRNAAREIRDMRSPARVTPLDHHHVPHYPSPPAFLRPACFTSSSYSRMSALT